MIEIEVPGSKSITNRALMLAALSNGINVGEIAMDTTISSHFVSALLMTGVMLPQDLKIRMFGGRKTGAYIRLTLSMMQKFGIKVLQEEDYVCYVPYNLTYHVAAYQIEPDVSGACYFYAMAFTLIGLRVDGIVIDNPYCCVKTFENYFDIIDELTMA